MIFSDFRPPGIVRGGWGGVGWEMAQKSYLAV